MEIQVQQILFIVQLKIQHRKIVGILTQKSITVRTAGNKTLKFEGTQVYAQREILIANIKLIEKLVYDETRIDGALINSPAVPIIDLPSMNNTNQGTGFFWNTKSTRRTDIINYSGLSGAGGVDF